MRIPAGVAGSKNPLGQVVGALDSTGAALNRQSTQQHRASAQRLKSEIDALDWQLARLRVQ